jgi:hypothetical protein
MSRSGWNFNKDSVQSSRQGCVGLVRHFSIGKVSKCGGGTDQNHLVDRPELLGLIDRGQFVRLSPPGKCHHFDLAYG